MNNFLFELLIDEEEYCILYIQTKNTPETDIKINSNFARDEVKRLRKEIKKAVIKAYKDDITEDFLNEYIKNNIKKIKDVKKVTMIFSLFNFINVNVE